MCSSDVMNVCWCDCLMRLLCVLMRISARFVVEVLVIMLCVYWMWFGVFVMMNLCFGVVK